MIRIILVWISSCPEAGAGHCQAAAVTDALSAKMHCRRKVCIVQLSSFNMQTWFHTAGACKEALMHAGKSHTGADCDDRDLRRRFKYIGLQFWGGECVK